MSSIQKKIVSCRDFISVRQWCDSHTFFFLSNQPFHPRPPSFPHARRNNNGEFILGGVGTDFAGMPIQPGIVRGVNGDNGWVLLKVKGNPNATRVSV
jgi:hypothetical protein